VVCIDGFFTFHEIIDCFYEAASEYIASRYPKIQPPDIGSVFPDSENLELINPEIEEYFKYASTYELEHREELEAYADWLFGQFILEYALPVSRTAYLYAFFPGSQIVRLPQHALTVTFLADGPFSLDEYLFFPDGRGDLRDFWWVDKKDWTISSGIKFPAPGENEGLDTFRRNLSLIDGWYLCWKAPTWPYDLSELAKKCSAAQYADKEEGSIERSGITRRSKGRPPKNDGIPQRAIRTYYLERLNKKDLPILQKEWILQDATVWAERILGINVPRSTMYRYLTPVFEAMDDRK
jgi:hypothetical protein